MRCRHFRRNSSSRFAGVREAVTIEDAVYAAMAINSRVRRECYFASAAAREKYLRGLMGLPAVPSTNERRSEGPG